MVIVVAAVDVLMGLSSSIRSSFSSLGMSRCGGGLTASVDVSSNALLNTFVK